MAKRYFHVTLTLSIVVAVLILLPNCATIIHGTTQDVTINSTPSQATIVVKNDGGLEYFNGPTPATVNLPRKYEYQVTVSLSGYQEQTVPIRQKFSMWYLGNIFCGGLIGLVIDYTNGAMNDLKPEQLVISLATAYNDDGSENSYIVFRTLDEDGQLRTMVVPMIKTEKSNATLVNNSHSTDE